MPVRELKSKITFSEFLDWNQFLIQENEQKWNQVDKIEYYLAQIAAAMAAAGGVRSKLSDFVLKFHVGSPESLEEKLKRSKMAWMSSVGYRPEDN